MSEAPDELEAIRFDDREYFTWDWITIREQRRTLLRMVDDLRSKLISAEATLNAERALHGVELRKVERKLAEAENDHDKVVDQLHVLLEADWKGRAGAAEARVKELEAVLHSMGVHDPS